MDENQQEQLALWMIAYQRGDITAFEKIYGVLKPRLYSYLVSQCLNQALAQDLLQETFLQLHRARATYMPGRPLLPWTFAIARHVFLMDRRARFRRGKREIPPEENLPEITSTPGTEDFFARDIVRRALAELPASQREPLLLHHIWGFEFKEIGGIMGIRAGAAKVRAHRGMARLRKALRGSCNRVGASGI